MYVSQIYSPFIRIIIINNIIIIIIIVIVVIAVEISETLPCLIKTYNVEISVSLDAP